MTTQEHMDRLADEIRESWERSLVGEETPVEREERNELTRQWYALRDSKRLEDSAKAEAWFRS